MYKIVLERKMCTSCGTCEDTCPEFFELIDDGLSHIKGSKIGDVEEIEIEDADCALDAAETCPVMCIHVYEDGEEIL